MATAQPSLPPRPIGGRNSMLQFDLQDSKAQVIRELSSILSSSIKRFMQQPGFDKIVSTFLLFFIATFQEKLVSNALEKARKQRLEGFDSLAVQCKMKELESEAVAHKEDLSPLYAMILLTHSSYQHVNRDRLFFEGLYISITNICDKALESLEVRGEIEVLMGQVFRGRFFNLFARLNSAPRSVDTLSLKELFAIKYETGNRALNSKLLTTLNARPQALNISAASVNNSPLISDMISSVITARALIKDPEFRKQRRPYVAVSLKGKNSPSNLIQLPGGNAAIHGITEELNEPLKASLDSTAAAKDVLGHDTAGIHMNPANPVEGQGPNKFIPPGYESFGVLYDDNLADLEDLKAYLKTGRHPKLEIQRNRRKMGQGESIMSRLSALGSLAASSVAGSVS